MKPMLGWMTHDDEKPWAKPMARKEQRLAALLLSNFLVVPGPGCSLVELLECWLDVWGSTRDAVAPCLTRNIGLTSAKWLQAQLALDVILWYTNLTLEHRNSIHHRKVLLKWCMFLDTAFGIVQGLVNMPSDGKFRHHQNRWLLVPSPMVQAGVQLGQSGRPRVAAQVGTILYLLSSVKIGRDYLFSMDMCPVISKVKTLATRVDAKVFYYYKAGLTGPWYWRVLGKPPEKKLLGGFKECIRDNHTKLDGDPSWAFIFFEAQPPTRRIPPSPLRLAFKDGLIRSNIFMDGSAFPQTSSNNLA